MGLETPFPVRWGLIGLGWVATDFVAPAMVQNNSSQLVACLGSSLEKGRAFAERFGVARVHHNLESIMHDSEVDAVYIALPNAMHHDTVTVLGRLDHDCQAVARATREVAQAENNLIIEGSDATLATSGLRFANEHIVRVRDAAGATEERFVASPAYALEVLAFEGELRGERSPLPDGPDGLQMVAVTQAVLQSIEDRRIVAGPTVA